MTSKNSTARKSRSQSKPQLTHEEVKRIAEKLAVALEHREEDISLITMLFDHLEQISADSTDLWCALYDIKKSLFVGTSASDEAQKQFQARAYQNRGKLLKWPYELGFKPKVSRRTKKKQLEAK